MRRQTFVPSNGLGLSTLGSQSLGPVQCSGWKFIFRFILLLHLSLTCPQLFEWCMLVMNNAIGKTHNVSCCVQGLESIVLSRIPLAEDVEHEASRHARARAQYNSNYLLRTTAAIRKAIFHATRERRRRSGNPGMQSKHKLVLDVT